MNLQVRTAPQGARFSRPSAQRLASIDAMVARAAAFGIGGRMAATNIAPDAPNPAPAAPDAPNTPPDTAARLDAHDAELADHAARITVLEERSPPPPPVDTGAQAAPPAASAAAPVSTMVSGTAIYARMNARSIGLTAPAAAAPSLPVMIQTAAGPIVNARAIHDRHNAAAARASRGSRG